MAKRLLYRPTATAALRVERDLTRTSYGIDLAYTGQRYADEKNTVLLPSFATLGGFGRLSLGAGSSVMLRLDDLTGERVEESYGYPVIGPTMSLTFSQAWR